MPQLLYDFNPVSDVVVDAIGEPGHRTFYLQGRQGRSTVTVIIEKLQAQALADGIDELLEKLGEPPNTSKAELSLDEPLEPLFRVAQIGLGHDERTDRLVIIAYDSPDGDEDDAEASGAVRFWMSRDQARALAAHARIVCAGGRPTCVLCGNPIDAEGHFCPKRNGH
ncbi:MAG: DUF3090 domain-containing protein [Chloroflexi bacterium]|nr:DUF3090 domain-containing protein [Chloroflexota bacterium]